MRPSVAVAGVDIAKIGDRIGWWGARIVLGVTLAALVARVGPQTTLARWIGETMLARGAPSMLLGPRLFGAPHAPGAADGWGGMLATALAWRWGGWAGATIAQVALAFAAFAILELRCRRRALDSWGRLGAEGFALCFAAGALMQGAGGWPLLVASLTASLVERPRPRSRMPLVPLALIAAQVGPIALIVPTWAAATSLGEIVASPRAPTRSRVEGAAIVAASALALFVVPGLRAPAHALRAIASGSHGDPQFLAATFGHGTPGILFVLAIAAAIRWVAPARRLGLAVAALAGVFDVRLLAAAALVVAPDIAVAVRAALPRIAPRIGVALALLVAALLTIAREDAAEERMPTDVLAAATALRADAGTPRVVCAQPSWCDVVLATAPRAEVLVDGRVWLDPFPRCVTISRRSRRRIIAGRGRSPRITSTR